MRQMQVVVKLEIPFQPVLWYLEFHMGWIQFDRAVFQSRKPPIVADAQINFRVDCHNQDYCGYCDHQEAKTNECLPLRFFPYLCILRSKPGQEPKQTKRHESERSEKQECKNVSRNYGAHDLLLQV